MTGCPCPGCDAAAGPSGGPCLLCVRHCALPPESPDDAAGWSGHEPGHPERPLSRERVVREYRQAERALWALRCRARHADHQRRRDTAELDPGPAWAQNARAERQAAELTDAARSTRWAPWEQDRGPAAALAHARIDAAAARLARTVRWVPCAFDRIPWFLRTKPPLTADDLAAHAEKPSYPMARRCPRCDHEAPPPGPGEPETIFDPCARCGLRFLEPPWARPDPSPVPPTSPLLPPPPPVAKTAPAPSQRSRIAAEPLPSQPADLPPWRACHGFLPDPACRGCNPDPVATRCFCYRADHYGHEPGCPCLR